MPPTATPELTTIEDQLVALAEKAKAIEAKAARENRALTEEEQTDLDRYSADFSVLEAKHKRESFLATPQRRQTQPEPLAGEVRQRVTGGDRVGATRESWGWESPGAFALGIIAAAKGRPDPRILNAPTYYGSEGTAADGGFAVPPDFRQEIMSLVSGDDSLTKLCNQQLTNSNAITLPIDSTSPHQTSGGVLVSWSGEAAAIGQSKPSLGQVECRLNKLAALVPLSDELMEDSPALSRWLPAKIGEKINAAMNTAIVSGSGVGQPLGLLNANCKITVAAESGQGANTIIAKNCVKMLARLPTSSRKNAVWLCHPDVEQQLALMVMPGTSPNAAIFLPGGTMINAGASTLLGRPLVVTEAASALGTEGDLILADLSQYLVVSKTSGVRNDWSMHLFFDLGVTAFRATFRVGGQSLWPAAVARQNGSSTFSPIITLNSTRT